MKILACLFLFLINLSFLNAATVEKKRLLTKITETKDNKKQVDIQMHSGLMSYKTLLACLGIGIDCVSFSLDTLCECGLTCAIMNQHHR